MHSPFDLRSKFETTIESKFKAAPPSRKRALWVAAIVIAAVAIAAYIERRPLHDWLFGPSAPATILVSGNIEAHQAVLGFKTVQSTIVELPFDEGRWVDKGTLIARLDDSDYRQQVAVNQATLEMQKRQLAAAQKNLIASRARWSTTPPILNSARPNTSAPLFCWRRAPAPSSSATRPTRPGGRPPPRICAIRRWRTRPSARSNWPREISTSRRKT